MAATRASDPDDAAVTIEYFSWLCRELGMGDRRRVVVELSIAPESTVRDLLTGLARESEPFQRTVYDLEGSRLREYVTLIVNGRLVDLAGGLDARLQPGDQLTLLPGFSGG